MQESIAELFGPHVAESELANSEVEIASAEMTLPPGFSTEHGGASQHASA